MTIKVSQLSRQEIVDILENQLCTQCYDEESTTVLREALQLHVDSGDSPSIVLS